MHIFCTTLLTIEVKVIALYFWNLQQSYVEYLKIYDKVTDTKKHRRYWGRTRL